jgi:hypothetical protein
VLHGPFSRGLIEPVAGELDHDQGATCSEQVGDLVQGHPEVFDVVQGQARHDVVERIGIGELLDLHTAEDRTFGRPRVDRGYAVAGTREGSSQLPLTATDL